MANFIPAGAAGGVVEKMIDHTWEGTGDGDRIIILDDDYDFILVFLEEGKAAFALHLPMAYAFKTCYGSFFVMDPEGLLHSSMANTNGIWQGKVFIAEHLNEIKLGSVGGDAAGTNYLDYTYRLIGFKFSSMG